MIERGVSKKKERKKTHARERDHHPWARSCSKAPLIDQARPALRSSEHVRGHRGTDRGRSADGRDAREGEERRDVSGGGGGGFGAAINRHHQRFAPLLLLHAFSLALATLSIGRIGDGIFASRQEIGERRRPCLKGRGDGESRRPPIEVCQSATAAAFLIDPPPSPLAASLAPLLSSLRRMGSPSSGIPCASC